MILNDAHLPLSGGERRWLAYLTRYHRGTVPGLRRDGMLRRSDDHESLLQILSLLRAADALDGRTMTPPKLSFALTGSRLRVRCRLSEDSAKARRIYCRGKKVRLFEDLFGCRFVFDIAVADKLSLVA